MIRRMIAFLIGLSGVVPIIVVPYAFPATFIWFFACVFTAICISQKGL